MTVRVAESKLAAEARQILLSLGVDPRRLAGASLVVRSPIDGRPLATLDEASVADAREAVGRAHAAFLKWRSVPAPRRGELVRLLGAELRAAKAELGRLATIEVGKVESEGLGEVQEMIDICDFALGLSRQLYGLTIQSERPDHKLVEAWRPAGVISAFNFPVAVWSWNAALALVCGDSVVWKPSEKAPLCALAVEALYHRAAAKFGPDAPDGLLETLICGRTVGEALVDDERVPVISATGSTRMGRIVGERLARRFARGILELGGNNASIVTPSADLDLTLRAVAFGAMGTAGQRCTSMRRLIVHGERVEVNGADAFYARPALVEMPAQVGPVIEETFAPILYVLKYRDFDEAIALHNGVPQGLSSSIFATDIREVERFLSEVGSDCGIANVNMGTSGAEIGGAFGGEKETGGGRESGSDAWKAYMRRQTSAVNYGRSLPLAQGVTFDV